MSALLLGLVGAVCWAVYDIFVRVVSNKIPLLTFLLNVLIAGFLANVVYLIAKQVIIETDTPLILLPSSSILKLAIASGLLFLIGSICLYKALKDGPVRLVAPIVASYPAFSVFWAYIQGESLSLLQWCAIAAIILGTTCVAATSQDEEEQQGHMGITALCSLIAALTFSASLEMAQTASALVDESIVNLWSRGAAVAALTLGMVLYKKPLIAAAPFLPIIFFLGTIDVIGALSVFAAGQFEQAYFAVVSASTFGIITIILAWLFLSEKMRPIQWISAGIAFLGIAYLALVSAG